MRERPGMTTGTNSGPPGPARLPDTGLPDTGLLDPDSPGSTPAVPDGSRQGRVRRRITLPATPSSARAARSFIREVLDGWGAGAFEDDAGLLATELVTNALRHATAPIALTLTLTKPDTSLRISVEDHSPAGIPVRRELDVHATDGRGLALVDEIAARWGVIRQHRRGTKLVWCELRVPPGASGATALAGRPGPDLG